MKNSNRNVSLDVLRVLIMFMIVLGHSLVHGGVLEKTPLLSISYFSFYTLRSFLGVHVNCFLLLSGYFLSSKKLRLSKVLGLWLQMFFWSVLLFFAVTLIQGNPIDIKELIESLMPFTQQRYWFMTTYLLMYLLSPVLNAASATITKQQYNICLLIYFAVFICLQNIVMWREFTAVNPTDPLFFCFLYMLGAYFRKYPIQRNIPWLLMYVGCSAVTATSRFILEWLTILIFGEPMGGSILSGYCSITNVVGAVALFMIFVNLKLEDNSKIVGLAVNLSPLTLGIYLIHDHSNVRSFIWNLLHPWSYVGSGGLLLVLLADSVVIFAVCCFLEWIRQRLFEVCRINITVNNMSDKIEGWIIKKVSLLAKSKNSM